MNFKKILLGFVFLFCFSFNNAFCADITWLNYENGIDSAKKQGKKVFLHFYADWCGYCKVMQSKTFKDESVINYLNENFVSIKVNSDKEQPLASKYGVRGLPTNFFLSEKGDIIGSRPGYIPQDLFLKMMQYVKTNNEK